MGPFGGVAVLSTRVKFVLAEIHAVFTPVFELTSDPDDTHWAGRETDRSVQKQFFETDSSCSIRSG